MSTPHFLSRPVLLICITFLLTATLIGTALAQSTVDSSSGTTQPAMAAKAEDPTKIHYEWAHGALMSIAFGFFLPVGIIFARFFRSPQYSPVWFHLHRVFVLIGFALIIAGFAIAVNKFDNDNYSKREGKYHRSAGFYVFAAFCLQVALGFIRPHTPPPGSGEKVSTARTVWNEVHRWNGRIAYVFALAQVYTGIQILDGGSMNLWIILFSALWGSLILFALLLQVVICVKGSAFGDDGTYTRTTITGNTTEKLNPQQAAVQKQNAVQMQGVKVEDGRSGGVPAGDGGGVVQGASITRPVDGAGSSPVLYAAAPAPQMTVVQIA